MVLMVNNIYIEPLAQSKFIKLTGLAVKNMLTTYSKTKDIAVIENN
jgi:hypothetical protein